MTKMLALIRSWGIYTALEQLDAASHSANPQNTIPNFKFPNNNALLK
jgi:hypothetical protein